MIAELEVAESMYQDGKAAIGPKMPDALDECARHTQERYLRLARAAIKVTGPPGAAAPSPAARELLDLLAEHLAFKLNHPQQFWDGVREAFDRYVQVVGEDHLSDEVKAAMAI